MYILIVRRCHWLHFYPSAKSYKTRSLSFVRSLSGTHSIVFDGAPEKRGKRQDYDGGILKRLRVKRRVQWIPGCLCLLICDSENNVCLKYQKGREKPKFVDLLFQDVPGVLVCMSSPSRLCFHAIKYPREIIWNILWSRLQKIRGIRKRESGKKKAIPPFFSCSRYPFLDRKIFWWEIIFIASWERQSNWSLDIEWESRSTYVSMVMLWFV